jgi:hypothetical protein
MPTVIDQVTAEAVPPPPQPEEPPMKQAPSVDPEQILALWRRTSDRTERLWVD